MRSSVAGCMAMAGILSVGAAAARAQDAATVPASGNPTISPTVNPTWFGQIDDRDPLHPRLGYPGTGLDFRFRGTGAQLQVTAAGDKNALTIVIDHGAPELRLLSKGDSTLDLLSNAPDTTHTVLIVKRSETWQGIVTVNAVTLAPGAAAMDAPPLPARRLLFIGDSVTCGDGIDYNDKCANDREHPAGNGYESYGLLLGRRLDADTHLVCYGGRGLERDYRGFTIADNVVNAPDFLALAIASDDPAGRVPWDTARWEPDAIFISLGTNDFNLQPTKPLDEKKWVGEYVAFLRAVRRDYPHSLVLLTEGAIVTNPLLKNLVQRAAAQSLDSRVIYLPSVHYPGNGCNGHPTRAQHVRMADDFEPALRKVLAW